MYKVIGVDGKEYGPISLEQLKQWIAQGRVNAQTRIQESSSVEWKTAVEFPELAALVTPAPVQSGLASTPVGGLPLPVPAGSPAGKKGLAVTSLIFGILAIPTCFLTGIPAIICGHVAHARARRAPAEYTGGGMALAGLILGYASLAIIPILAIMAAMLLPALARAKDRAQRISCANNLKQMGVSFRVWALDHNDQFPFNVSTNTGGTLEVCAPGPDGFDRNSWLHFMTLSNELGSTRVLVCPKDPGRQPALDFQQLQAANVSYQLRSGTNLTETHPDLILVVCPIHHNALMCDGAVQMMTATRLQQVLQQQSIVP